MNVFDLARSVTCNLILKLIYRSMEPFNAPDALLPSAGLNPTLFRVNLKKGKGGFGFDTFGSQEYGKVWKRIYVFV